MSTIRWKELTPSARIAAAAFALHALLLLVDIAFFGGAYSGEATTGYWSVLRIVAFALFAWSIVLNAPRMWLLGLVAFAGFFVSDVFNLGSLVRDPRSGPGLAMLTIALMATLTLGIGATWWPSVRSAVRAPAA